jgi:cysteinyl-tRNA synthetase
MHGYFLQLDEARMSKSSGEFLRLQSLIDRGYDPLAYRYFCLGAHYRSKLTFSWQGIDSAAKSIERLRSLAHEWGQPGPVDEDYADQFMAQVNDDLNLPRALAVAWDLARSDLAASSKKATLLFFDEVLGLGLEDWQPPQATIPGEIMALVEQRELARSLKKWDEADNLRERIIQAGFEIEDTSQGPRLKKKHIGENQ